MSDRMIVLSFSELLHWVMTEKKQNGSIFGLRRFYRHDGSSTLFLDGSIEIPCGPAAGPHTQLSQNLVAAYLAGARFFELKTVQTLDGEDLEVAKPCIWAGDEAYNVEWSTELRVEQAMQEYINAYILLQVIAKEFQLGDPQGFVFNMSVGYTLDGIKSAKINNFIDGLIDATTTDAWHQAIADLRANIDLFEHFQLSDIDNLQSQVCSSIALSTLHGAKPEEIEPMLRHLIGEKGLHTYLKMNPTLLGYDNARALLDRLGYKHLAFDRTEFDHDLKFDDAQKMITRLLDYAAQCGKQFGVKLTNTFPVAIKDDLLPGEMMYMSGKPLFVLSLSVAMLIAKSFPDITISYSGGADAFNIHDLYATGISPITICTTLLKDGGYYRQIQISEQWQRRKAVPKLDIAAMQQLLERVLDDRHYRVSHHYKAQKAGGKLPLHQCFSEPCQTGCPIQQDVSSYLHYAEKGDYDAAMRVVLDRNPLPFITGSICYAFCESKCTRNHCDDNLAIRATKLQIAQRSTVRSITGTAKNGKTAIVVGGGASGMATAHLLARKGYQVELHERQAVLGGILTKVIKNEPKLQEYIDADQTILENLGVKVVLNSEINHLEALIKQYDAVYLATGATAFARLLGIDKDDHKQLIEKAKQLDITLVGEAFSQKKSSVVACIASAWQAVGELPSISDAAPVDSIDIYNKKGLLLPVKQDDAARCLHCDTICENCVDVCPNRANLSFKIDGFDQPEIVHFDDFCNECGNCTMFCPYDGSPYLEKFTYFSKVHYFEESNNPGFCLVDDEVRYRLDGQVKQCKLADIKGKIGLVIGHIIANESYILRR